LVTTELVVAESVTLARSPAGHDLSLRLGERLLAEPFEIVMTGPYTVAGQVVDMTAGGETHSERKQNLRGFYLLASWRLGVLAALLLSEKVRNVVGLTRCYREMA
jgi:hypothetical protein